MAWISVRNWRKFQHYDPATRQPKWIKNYTELLASDEYLQMPAGRRALLHGLWLIYALACTCPKDRDDLECTCLRLDVQLLNRRLGLNAKLSDYESLNHAGFLVILASKPLATRYQDASLDLEVEEEEEEPSFLPTPTKDVEQEGQDYLNGHKKTEADIVAERELGLAPLPDTEPSIEFPHPFHEVLP